MKRNSTDKKETQGTSSEFQEHSQNLLTEPMVKTFEIRFEEKPKENKICLAVANFENILRIRGWILASK